MSDLEWYLDVGGKQSGPHSAKEIVEMVRGGKIPATSQVTAARMGGDWVVAQDLIDAYDELYTKPAMAVPGSGAAFAATTTDPNYTAPPRPTEQLEKSKIITLNREEFDKIPDPTEALFQAIQAVREKANQKGATGAATTSAAARDTFGQLNRAAGPRIPPQLLFIGMIAAILAATVYGVMKMTAPKVAEETSKPAAVKRASENPPPAQSPPATGGLLNDDGGGTSAARTTPPVQRPPRNTPGRQMGGRGTMREDYVDKNSGGGARYRDERDAPVEEEPDVDESDIEPTREIPEPMPVDPSQIPTDRIIPEPGTIPGRGALPGADPYVPPPPQPVGG